MHKLIRSLREHEIPKEFTRDDWCAATRTAFAPYFHRKRKLDKNIDLFNVELRNLARIASYPEYLTLLLWCLRLYRRVLRLDRQAAYENMLLLFSNMQASANRWMSMFETSAPLESGAAIHDRAYQLFSTIDGVSEGCYKPQLQILFSFAQRNAGRSWPKDATVLDFGRLVGAFPDTLRNQAPLLLADPEFLLSVNQWRNIAAHKSFRVVGPKTIEITYGKGTIHSRRLGFYRLRKVWHWLSRVHTALHLANTIIYIEHMSEICAIGVPAVEMRLSATLTRVGHGLSTVGFESLAWKIVKRDGVLVLSDRWNRDPQHALIHASQILDQLSIGVLSDPSTRNRLDRVGIALVLPDGSRFATVIVPIQVANAFTLRKISQKEYLSHMQWDFERRT